MMSYNTAEEKAKRKVELAAIIRAHEIADSLPENLAVTVMFNKVSIQAHNLAEVTSTRRLFSVRKWGKVFSENCKWWEFIALEDGVEIQIYACSEAPRGCRLVEKVVTEKRYEPETPIPNVRYVEREVQITKKVWQCGPGAAA